MWQIRRDYLKIRKVPLKFLTLKISCCDEADNSVDKFIDNIQLNWKCKAENNKFIYQCRNQLNQQQEQQKNNKNKIQ